jgi:hypothetical protein
MAHGHVERGHTGPGRAALSPRSDRIQSRTTYRPLALVLGVCACGSIPLYSKSTLPSETVLEISIVVWLLSVWRLSG